MKRTNKMTPAILKGIDEWKIEGDEVEKYKERIRIYLKTTQNSISPKVAKVFTEIWINTINEEVDRINKESNQLKQGKP